MILPLAVGAVLLVATALTSSASLSQEQMPSQTARVAEIRAYLDEGAAAFRRQEYGRAREFYTKALELSRQLNDEPAIAESLSRLGATHYILGDHAQALALMIEALRSFEEVHDVASQAMIKNAIGETYLEIHNESEARRMFDESLELAPSLLEKATNDEVHKIHVFVAHVWSSKGLAHERLREFSKSIEAYVTASSLFQQERQRYEAGEALMQAGRVATIESNHTAAASLYLKAEVLFQNSGALDRAKRAALFQGHAFVSQGKTEEAEEIFKGIALTDDGSPSSTFVPEANYHLGMLYEGRGQFDLALEHYQAAKRSLPVMVEGASGLLKASIHLSLGQLLLHLAQYDDASVELVTSASTFNSTGNSEGEALAQLLLGETARWAGDFRAARLHNEQALSLYRKHGALLPQVRALANLMEVVSVSGAQSLSESDKTIAQYMEQGIELEKTYLGSVSPKAIQEQLYSSKDVFRTNLYQQLLKDGLEADRSILEQWPLPSAEFSQAYGEVRILGSEIEFSEKGWRTKFPFLTGDYFHIFGNFWQAVGIALLEIYNDPKTARHWLENAELYHSSAFLYRDGVIGLAKDWYYLGEAHRRSGNSTKALLYFYRSYFLAAAFKTPEIHWVYAGLGRTFADQRQLEAAILLYSTGLAQFEAILHQAYLEATKSDVIAGAIYAYRPLVGLLLEQYRRTRQEHYRQEAFQVNEALRARGFLELLVRSRAASIGTASETTEQLRLEIAGLQHRMHGVMVGSADQIALANRLQTLRETWLQHQRETSPGDPTRVPFSVPHIVNLEELQQSLDQDSVVLEYMLSHDRLILWAITVDTIAVFEQQMGQAHSMLDDFLKSVRQPLLTHKEISMHLNMAEYLYTVLLQPVESFIQNKRHLIVIPDGKLQYLPFETLVRPVRSSERSASSAKLSNAAYVVKTYRITYAPSAAVVLGLHAETTTKKEKAPLPLVAFGDPLYEEVSNGDRWPEHTESKWSRLEFSEAEINRIANAWGIPSTSPHLNVREQASLKRLRELDLSQYRIVHFATHAFVTDSYSISEQPSLVLSDDVGGGRRKDTLLRFEDILKMRLNADLVVLSACRTNLGQLKDGEGLVGLSRAFFYAGASSLVVSLWDVQDQSTSLLMEHFYKGIKAGLSKAEALRRAKLELMMTTTQLKATGRESVLNSPFFWAPFIYFGSIEH